MYLGAVIGGPDVDPECPLLAEQKRLWKRLAGLMPAEGSTPLIDLVFHVPGSMLQPEFTGIRVGSFSRKHKLVQIQVAVPESELNGPNPKQFLIASMRSAVTLAEARFRKAGLALDIPLHASFISAVESAGGSAA